MKILKLLKKLCNGEGKMHVFSRNAWCWPKIIQLLKVSALGVQNWFSHGHLAKIVPQCIDTLNLRIVLKNGFKFLFVYKPVPQCIDTLNLRIVLKNGFKFLFVYKPVYQCSVLCFFVYLNCFPMSLELAF